MGGSLLNARVFEIFPGDYAGETLRGKRRHRRGRAILHI